MRFSTTCRATHQLVGSSPVLFRKITATLCARRLPPGKEMQDQMATGGAQRLVDGLTSLPALEGVLLVFADEGMLEEPCFVSITDGLGQADVDVEGILFEDIQSVM